MLKRTFDVVVASSLLVLLSPVLVLVALLVRVSAGRPVLFRQTRPGLHEKPFRIVKFRTMRPADSAADQLLLDDGPRLTRLGRVLRSTSLDELPELWNVVRGQMSLVGPRPLLAEYLPLYSPEQATRHSVRPGITGLAQVGGRNALSWERKLELDATYAATHSLGLDARVLLRTARCVVLRSGVVAEGSATAPVWRGGRRRGAARQSASPVELDHGLLTELCDEHGDGFFLLDLVSFREDYLRILNAFRATYADVEIAYSYKTNYLPAICREVDRLGGRAEVVSHLEYQLARSLDVDPRRIVVNGPGKRPAELEEALLAGATVNLDSVREVGLVEDVSERWPGHELRVGLRCNLGLDAKPSRFGLDVDAPEFAECIARLLRLPGCRVVGLHCHVSTSDRDPADYRRRAERLIALAAEHLPYPPETLNLGGGFFSRMSDGMRAQFDQPAHSFEAYADAIAGALRDAYPSGGPTLVLEPGTAVAARSLSYAARVLDVKTVRGRTLALVAGSVHNVKPTLHDKRLSVTTYTPRPQPAPDGRVVDVVGYTCMEHDVLLADQPGPLSVGDVLVFEDVGAYTLVMQPPFIMAAPPVLWLDAEQVHVVRRREQTSDVFATSLPVPTVAGLL